MPLDNLNFQTVELDESDLDSLLSGNSLPDSTVSADSLPHSKEVVDDDTPTPASKSKGKQEIEEPTPFQEHDEDFLDSLLSADEDDKEPDPKDKVKEEKKDEEPVIEEKTKSKSKKTELDEESLRQISDYYIKSGQWKDFEGREEFEYNAENFQDLIDKQNQLIAEEKYNDKLEAIGDVGKQIISYIEKGGNPDNIIDLFKEQKQITDFKTDSIDEKKAFIAQYYQAVHDLSDNQIKRLLTIAEAEGTLDEDVDKIKDSYKKHYQKELDKMQEDQQIYQVQQKEAQEKFENAYITEINSRKNLTDKDKQILKDTVLKYDQRLEDGSKVSKFYLKFMEMQNNMADYADFVEFVLNKEKFIEKIRKVEETKATEKAFFKVKGNAAVSGKSGSSTVAPANSNKKEEIISLFGN